MRASSSRSVSLCLLRPRLARMAALDSLVLSPSSASPESGAKLFSEWSLFWDTSRALLLEKTPENFLMGPFWGSVGQSSTRFAFVMRHPLVWALATEKWIFPDFVALRTVEERIAFWFDTMSRMVDQLLVCVMSSAAARQPAHLQSCSLRLQGTFVPTQSARPITTQATLAWVVRARPLASSLSYVTCWLGGMEFKASLRRCDLANRSTIRPIVCNQICWLPRMRGV